MIIRTKQDLLNIKKYRCATKSKSANSRFVDYISKEDVLDVLKRFNYECFYCSEKIKPHDWHLDHYNPKANGGLNVTSNLVCSCRWCNIMKNALDGVAFINKCNTIINNNWLSKNNINIEISDTKQSSLKKKIHKKIKKEIKNKINLNDVDEILINNIYDVIYDVLERNEHNLNKLKLNK